jgi:hypothetical protein
VYSSIEHLEESLHVRTYLLAIDTDVMLNRGAEIRNTGLF